MKFDGNIYWYFSRDINYGFVVWVGDEVEINVGYEADERFGLEVGGKVLSINMSKMM